MTLTKLPDELQPGDRMVTRQGTRTTVLTVKGLRLTVMGLHVRFTDGSDVLIGDTSIPVEVSP